MKRKRWRIVEIMLGVLLLLFVLIGPAVTLWARPGVKPVCVEGE